MVEKLDSPVPGAIGFRISGKLHDEDYKTFVPWVDEAIAQDDKENILVEFHDFKGWDAHALWDDIKFATTHCTSIGQIAIVGDKTWEKHMATVCKPFTMAKVKYFDVHEIDAAWDWLKKA